MTTLLMMQIGTLVDVQEIIDEPPDDTLIGDAVIEKVGVGPIDPTVTITVCVTDVPPDPVQEPVYIVVVVRGPVETLPDVLVCEIVPPVMVQEEAFVDDQVRVAELLDATEVGEAERVRVGTEPTLPDMFTVTFWIADVPPVPVQEPENVVVAVSAPEEIPAFDVPVCHELPFFVIEQEAALVDDQLIVDAWPEATDVGDADNSKSGATTPPDGLLTTTGIGVVDTGGCDGRLIIA